MPPHLETTGLLELENYGSSEAGSSYQRQQQQQPSPPSILSNRSHDGDGKQHSSSLRKEQKNTRPCIRGGQAFLGNATKTHVCWAVGGAVIGVAVYALLAFTLSFSNTSLHAMETAATSRYKKVQGLGYGIYTGGAPAFFNDTERTRNPECIGLNSYGVANFFDSAEIQCYVGYEDPIQDARERVAVMKEAVERAYALADPDDQTLKVFLAPEFFGAEVLRAPMSFVILQVTVTRTMTTTAVPFVRFSKPWKR